MVATQKAKILVCEDNVALSGVITFNLVRAGFEVTSVGNGRLALEARLVLLVHHGVRLSS